jgi:hypothetical protein
MPALAALVQQIVAEDHDRRPAHARDVTRRTTEPGEDAARGDGKAEQEPVTATLRLAHAGA